MNQTDLPEAFVSRMRALLGTEFDEYCALLNTPVRRAVRVNRLKCTPQRFCEIAPPGLAPLPFSPEGFFSPEELDGRHPWHHAGLFYFQEPSAMAAVTAAAITPGMRVLDLCAAPGGKSTQAAAALGGSGVLVSNEVVPARARILLSNLERCGVRNAAVTSARPDRLCETLRGFFDAVLVDAPCSGEGMFRREPAALAGWRPALPQENARRQLLILDSAARALREGGVLLYSTCTFSPDENEGVIAAFLRAHPEFEPEAIETAFGRPAFPAFAGGDERLSLARRIFPMDGGEGHFVARLRKRAPEPCDVRPFAARPLSRADERLFADFYASQFDGEPYGIPCAAGDSVFLLPEALPALPEGLLRAGVPAGRIKNGRFEPEHALYLAENGAGLRNPCDLPLQSAELAAFLRGEEIPAPPGAAPGWAGVLAQGFAVGFGKISNGVVKNHYPKGLRNLR